MPYVPLYGIRRQDKNCAKWRDFQWKLEDSLMGDAEWKGSPQNVYTSEHQGWVIDHGCTSRIAFTL